MLKILRLVNGDDIIANVNTESKDKILLECPFDMTTVRSDNGVSIMLLPWLPVEFIEDNSTTIDKDRILIDMNPSKKLKDYYNKSLDILIKKLIRIESQTGGNDFDDVTDKIGQSLVVPESNTIH